MIRKIAVIAVAVASLLSPPNVSATISKLNADDTDQTMHRRLSDLPGHGTEKGGDILSHLLQMKSHTRKLDETKHYCGVILFYHVPGTEGTEVNEWLGRLKDANNAEYISSVEEKSFAGAVGTQIQRIEGWKIVYAQENSFSFNSDESFFLEKWRDVVTDQNCRFVATTMFADIIDHSVSHTYEKFMKCHCTPQEFKDRGYDFDDAWRGQLDYFLFNNGEVKHMELKKKVQRAMDVLKQHFDLVLLSNHDKFVDTVLRLTGWASPGPLAEKTHGNLTFTKDLVGKFYKLAEKNGDGDFIDAVSHVYSDNLGYLLAELSVQ